MPAPATNISDLFYSGDAFIGYGAQWKIGQNDSPETFVAVAQISSIQPGAMSAGIVNKTHLRSPGRAHEKISTVRDIGPFTMRGQLNLHHGSQTNAGGHGFTGGGIIALHRAQSERNMQIVLADSPATTLPFRGVISNYQIGEISLENVVEFTVEVQPLADYTASLP